MLVHGGGPELRAYPAGDGWPRGDLSHPERSEWFTATWHLEVGGTHRDLPEVTVTVPVQAGES